MFEVFVIDPPWPKRKGGIRKVRPNQGRQLDYPTMAVSEIFVLLDERILSQAASPHCVFLWAIDEFLIDSEIEMDRRGYKRHARIIWDKCNGVAPAFTVRYAHEYMVWFYKPRLPPIAESSRGKICTVMREPAREHSRKPNCAYEAISKWYPNARKLDVFSREPRKGWSQWGDQTTHFIQPMAIQE